MIKVEQDFRDQMDYFALPILMRMFLNNPEKIHGRQDLVNGLLAFFDQDGSNQELREYFLKPSFLYPLINKHSGGSNFIMDKGRDKYMLNPEQKKSVENELGNIVNSVKKILLGLEKKI